MSGAQEPAPEPAAAVPGTGLVEWFAQWRERAKAVLGRMGEP